MAEIDLRNESLTPSDIEAASDGYFTKRTRQHTGARGLWATAIDPAAPGKAQIYKVEHAYEAAIIGAGVHHGLTTRRIKEAIIMRMIAYLADKGVPGGWVGEAREHFPELPELQNEDEDWYWVIVPEHAQPRGPHHFVEGVKAVRGKDALAKAMARTGGVLRVAFVLSISSIIRDVNRILRARIAEKAKAITGTAATEAINSESEPVEGNRPGSIDEK